MSDRSTPKNNIQLIWAIALVLAGIGVFVRIPQVMPKLAQIDQFADALGYIRVCFYIMGILLIGGGVQKIFRLLRPASSPSANATNEAVDK